MLVLRLCSVTVASQHVVDTRQNAVEVHDSVKIVWPQAYEYYCRVVPWWDSSDQTLCSTPATTQPRV
jgi:hypothetical protein